MKEPWTTQLGRELLALENGGASDHDIARLQDELRGAFNQLRHIRKCYSKQATKGGAQ